MFNPQCFPVLTDLITYGPDPDHFVDDGVAVFQYTVPYEEVSAKIAAFSEKIVIRSPTGSSSRNRSSNM